jgi:hypothetical protein
VSHWIPAFAGMTSSDASCSFTSIEVSGCYAWIIFIEARPRGGLFKLTRRKELQLERRIYFLAGDALSNVVMGMAAAWLSITLVDPSWSMPVGMFAGMFAGMGLGLLLVPVFVGLFGAMEVMLPVMLTAMVSGMVFGMAGAMQAPATPEFLLGGGAIGLLVLLLTYAVDAHLHGKAR